MCDVPDHRSPQETYIRIVLWARKLFPDTYKRCVSSSVEIWIDKEVKRLKKRNINLEIDAGGEGSEGEPGVGSDAEAAGRGGGEGEGEGEAGDDRGSDQEPSPRRPAPARRGTGGRRGRGGRAGAGGRQAAGPLGAGGGRGTGGLREQVRVRFCDRRCYRTALDLWESFSHLSLMVDDGEA